MKTPYIFVFKTGFSVGIHLINNNYYVLHYNIIFYILIILLFKCPILSENGIIYFSNNKYN
jgi:hypothetical protein